MTAADVLTTIKEYMWIGALIGLLLSILNAYFGGGWGRSGITWTFALTHRRQLNSTRKLQARLKHLHDTGGISGWLLSGILWLLFLFGTQLTLEAITATQLTRSPPPVQGLLLALLNTARYSVGFITMLVSINRLKWYRRLEYYDTSMAWMDRAIARLEAKQALHKPPVTAYHPVMVPGSSILQPGIIVVTEPIPTSSTPIPSRNEPQEGAPPPK